MPTDQLSTTLSALADPTRRAILARLGAGEATVTELARPFEMTLPAVSKHLKVLERAGLVARGREAQWRPARLDAGPLKDVSDWVETYRRHWEERFDRLDQYLKELQEQQKEDNHDPRIAVWPQPQPTAKSSRDARSTLRENSCSRLWIDPDHVAQWFGPDGFTTTVQEMDVRPGGVWRFIMHGPDGIDYDNRVDYIEVTEARAPRLQPRIRR